MNEKDIYGTYIIKCVKPEPNPEPETETKTEPDNCNIIVHTNLEGKVINCEITEFISKIIDGIILKKYINFDNKNVNDDTPEKDEVKKFIIMPGNIFGYLVYIYTNIDNKWKQIDSYTKYYFFIKNFFNEYKLKDKIDKKDEIGKKYENFTNYLYKKDAYKIFVNNENIEGGKPKTAKRKPKTKNHKKKTQKRKR